MKKKKDKGEMQFIKPTIEEYTQGLGLYGYYRLYKGEVTGNSFNDKYEVFKTIPMSQRHEGLNVIVGDEHMWFIGGIKDENLVLKEDKVTLKGVDKPEVFQHWTEDQVLSTANSCKEFLGDIDYAPLVQASYDGKFIHCKYDELTGKILHTIVDPYHIEPIDNPQKPTKRQGDRNNEQYYKISRFSDEGDFIENVITINRSIFSKQTLENIPYYIDEISAIILMRTQKETEFAMDILVKIKKDYPEVLEQFIKEHYGK